MFIQYFIVLITVICCVTANLSSFIEPGQRAEIFELTDNEVAVFRVNIPDDEFNLLKAKANVPDMLNFRINVTDYLQRLNYSLKGLIEALKEPNYHEKYPELDFDTLLPELHVDEQGFAQLNTDEIVAGFDLDVNHYRDYDYVHDNILIYAISSNPNFNILKLSKIIDLNLANATIDMEFKILFGILLGGGEEEESNEFKTKNASLTVKINDNSKKFKKVTISLGGEFSRSRSRPSFNIKIRDNNNDLYGRKQFKLRSDYNEATYLRSKLASDVHNRLGLTSISANYATLYINDEYMGLFILTDAYKLSWFEFEYNDENTKSLFQCKEPYSFLTEESSANVCTNENDEVTDISEWTEFLKSLDKAESASEIENIFDIDHFLTEMALDYLFGAWDHLLHNGHNYYMYKQPNGVWKYLSYDFDLDIGQNVDRVFLFYITEDMPERIENFNRDYPNYSFGEWIPVPPHLVDILIMKDSSRFDAILKNIVSKVFNPGTLFPHIDELKTFIRPYVELDKTPDANGHYPGRINQLASDFFSLAEWDANSEFTTIFTKPYCSYGIKYWILAKYRYVCKAYNIEDCDSVYLDENYTYPIDKEVEFKGYFSSSTNNETINTTTAITTTTTTTTATTTTLTSSTTPDSPTISSDDSFQCWSELVGYPCCPSELKDVYAQDAYGDWSYDFNKKEWCGLTPFSENNENENENECWSEKLGYVCCKGCQVYEVDQDGSWGYERNQWCGIPTYC